MIKGCVMEWIKKEDKDFPIGKRVMVRLESRTGDEYMEYVEVKDSGRKIPDLKVGNYFVDPDKVTHWMEVLPPAIK